MCLRAPGLQAGLQGRLGRAGVTVLLPDLPHRHNKDGGETLLAAISIVARVVWEQDY